MGRPKKYTNKKRTTVVMGLDWYLLLCELAAKRGMDYTSFVHYIIGKYLKAIGKEP